MWFSILQQTFAMFMCAFSVWSNKSFVLLTWLKYLWAACEAELSLAGLQSQIRLFLYID